MTDLEKYDLVNSCNSVEALAEAVLKCADGDDIEGRLKKFDAKEMSEHVADVVSGKCYPRVLTRKWGIRQQALWIKYYNRL